MDKMHLHCEILAVYRVFTGAVKVKLFEFKARARAWNSQKTAGLDILLDGVAVIDLIHGCTVILKLQFRQFGVYNPR